MKWSRPWLLIPALFSTLLLTKFTFFSSTIQEASTRSRPHHPQHSRASEQQQQQQKLIQVPSTSSHPIKHLENEASQAFQSLTISQSESLKEAVNEYKRRYGIPPPPLFDQWYMFAKKRGLELIDEFDMIHDSLLPFWALEPSSIRGRVREALGYEPNGLIALQIRGGRIARLEGGPKWQMNVMDDMIKDFIHFLPDMDLAFNLHDEPRIVVPHDELSEMIRIAKEEIMPAASANPKLQNEFSPRPDDVEDGKRRLKIPDSSRFNEYQHQAVWVPSRLSCSPKSPARDFHDHVQDSTDHFSLSDLGFVYNHTAFSDICLSPSLRDTFGFFQRPNAFKISHELIPIFSQSKISSFQDILYPSPWYYYGKTVTDQPPETHKLQYDETFDEDWDSKTDRLWWRGSTTGGFSREGGWRRQHRQTFVNNINADYNIEGKILVNHGTTNEPNWKVKEVPRNQYQHLVDVYFSDVGQCDPGDCDAQREYFDLVEPVDTQEAWKHRYLLDMDGNAFSGRFYSFLRSKSLPFKLSIFREWHQDWLMPWVHYVPISLRGDEHLETLRYLAEDEEGIATASKMATAGREWASKAIRNQDLEVWFFRLLLEYARVIDDNRDSVGFTL